MQEVVEGDRRAGPELPLSSLLCQTYTPQAPEKWGRGDGGFRLFSSVLSSLLCARHGARDSNLTVKPAYPGLGQ